MKIISIAVGVLLVSALAIVGGFFLAVEASGDHPPQTGTWSLNSWATGDDVGLKLSFRTSRSRWVWGTHQPLAELHGLEQEQLRSARVPVTFTLDRDAGSFVFEGTMVLGVGRGDVRFVPSATYAAQLAELGYETVADGELFELAFRDISLDFAREAKQLGLKNLTLTDLMKFPDHGIDLPFILAMKSAGCPSPSVSGLIALHDHGVDPEYVARVQASGYENLSIDDIIKLHDHGVD